MNALEVCPRVRRDIEYRELDDGGVVYDTAAGRVHTFNATAAYVWNLCDGGASAEQIAEGLREITGISRDQALKDVTLLLQELSREGLLDAQ